MLDALLVLVEGADIGAGLCLTLIVTDDELQFDTHSRAAPGSRGRRRGHAILPDFGGFPQHLHALLRQRVSRLVRETLSFSKTLAHPIGAIKYFICHDNWHGR